MAETDYTNIQNPYNDQMERQGADLSIGESLGGVVPTTNAATQTASPYGTTPTGGSVATGVSTTNGSVEVQPVKSDGAMADVWITNFIRSQNWKPKNTGFYIDGQTGYAEFTNVYVSGNIQALTGSIGGFKIGADYIEDTGDSFGFSSTVTGGNDVRLWAGATFANRDTAPFRVYEDGSIAGTGLTITKIDLPDTTTVASFHVDTAGNTWWGANVASGYATAPASVLSTGVVSFVSGTIGGNVLATTSIGSPGFVSGALGAGWNISSTGTAEFQNVSVRGSIKTSVFEKDTISAVNGMVLITSSDVLTVDMTALDSSTVTISGQTTFSPHEVLRIKDGTNDEYMLVTSVNGNTYTVNRDINNAYPPNGNPIWKKGTAIVSMGVGNGATLVTPAILFVNLWDTVKATDLILEEFTTSPTTQLFPLTIYVADKIAASEKINNSASTGFIILDSSSSYSPFIDIYGRNSDTYNDTSLHVRLGWLKGITDTSVGLNTTDTWGLYSDNVYLKGTINASAGRIGSPTNYWNITSNGITAISAGGNVIINYGKTTFDNTAAGFILGFDAASSLSKFYIGNTTNYLNWTGSAITIAGNIILGTSNFLEGGQTAFKTGDGFFFGYDSTNELDILVNTGYSPVDVLFADGTTTSVGQIINTSEGELSIKEIRVNMKKVSTNAGIVYCDVYATTQSGANLLPTGASLGQASISGLTNAAYAEQVFTFSSPITGFYGTQQLIFVFTSPSTTTGINIQADSSGSAYPFGYSAYYSGAWHYSYQTYMYFKVYSQAVGYKMSIGNSTYQMSYNTQNVSVTSNLLVRDPLDSTSYTSVGAYGVTIYNRGIRTVVLNNSSGLQITLPTYDGSLNLHKLFQFSPDYGMSGSAFTYVGTRFTTGYNGGTSGLWIFQNSTGGGWTSMAAASGNGILIGMTSSLNGNVPYNSNGQVQVGSAYNKAYLYAYGLTACPLPTVDNALDMIDATPDIPKSKKELEKPSKAHFEFQDKTRKRKYFDDIDIHDDMKTMNDAGEQDVEIVRVVGVLFKAVKELHAKIKVLEANQK